MDLREQMSLKQYTEIYGKVCENMDTVPESYYEKYGVKKGLRDVNGNGVLSGLTHVSKVMDPPVRKRCSACGCGTPLRGSGHSFLPAE